ncbi:hypothetical protein FF1_038322 [Malus domestica]
MNFCSSIAVEILTVIEAIRVAWVREWHHIWLETDSTIVIHYLNSPSSIIPWYLHVDWSNCLWQIKHMHVFVSHIFREGNSVADALANFGADRDAYYRWYNVPSCVASAYIHDLSASTSNRFG